jgi:hypothetical protein
VLEVTDTNTAQITGLTIPLMASQNFGWRKLGKSANHYTVQLLVRN